MAVYDIVFSVRNYEWPERDKLVDVYADEVGAYAMRLTSDGYVEARVFHLGDGWAYLVDAVNDSHALLSSSSVRSCRQFATRDEAANGAAFHFGTWRDVDLETYGMVRKMREAGS